MWKERVESRVTPKLQTSRNGKMEQPSTWRRRLLVFRSNTMGDDNHDFCLSAVKLVVIQVYMVSTSAFPKHFKTNITGSKIHFIKWKTKNVLR